MVAPFIGRGPEVERLGHLMAAVAAGAGAVVAVVGEPGIGKSRLLEQVVKGAAGGRFTLMAGLATERERDRPFAVVVDAFDETVEAVLATDPGVVGSSAGVLPAFARDGGGEMAPPAVDPVDCGRRLCRLLRTMATERPVVLVLDDLHWVDDGSAAFLDQLLRRAPLPGVFVVLAYRPRQTPTALAATVERAATAGWLELLPLATLSESEAAELIGAAVSERDLGVAYALSGGNPLYLETIRRRFGNVHNGHSESVGQPLRTVLVAELRRVADTALRLLQGAAALGDPFDAFHAATVAGVARETVTGALDELCDRDLIRSAGAARRFQFRHPLVRDAVYATAKRAWLVDTHRRAVDLLRDRGAGVLDQVRHVLQVADIGDLDAVAVLEQAARLRIASDPATAAHWLGEAARLLPHGPETEEHRILLLGERACALGRAGRLAESGLGLRELLPVVPRVRVDLRVRFARACAEADNLLGRCDWARGLIEAELRELPWERQAERASLLACLATGAFLHGALADSYRLARGATAVLPRDAPADLRMAATSALAVAAAASGDQPVAAGAAQASAALFGVLADDLAAPCLPSVAGLAWAKFYLGWHHRVRRVVAGATWLARRTGHHGALAPLLYCASATHHLAGRVQRAMDLARETEEVARAVGSHEQLSLALSAKAEAALWLGETGALPLQLAERAFATARADAEGGASTGMASRVAAFALAETSLTMGDPEQGSRALVAASGGPRLPAWPVSYRPRVFDLLTRLAIAAGALSTARHWVAGAEQDTRLAALGGASYLKRAQANLAYALGDPARAATLATAAAEGFRRAGFPLEEGRARATAVAAHLRVGALGPVAVEQRAIARIARDCGIARLQTLGNVGRALPARTPAASTPDPVSDPYLVLSRREREVANLLGTGMTNREIAGRLFITVRTVDAHVRRILRKLGVPSRAAVVGLRVRSESER